MTVKIAAPPAGMLPASRALQIALPIYDGLLGCFCYRVVRVPRTPAVMVEVHGVPPIESPRFAPHALLDDAHHGDFLGWMTFYSAGGRVALRVNPGASPAVARERLEDVIEVWESIRPRRVIDRVGRVRVVL